MEKPKDYPEIDLMSAAEKLAGAISGKTRLICRTIERCVLYVCLSVIIGLLFLSDARAHIEAEVLRVVDGDTVVIRIAPVPGTYHDLNVRIASVNVPEKVSDRYCETHAAWRAEALVEKVLAEAVSIHLDNIRLGTWAGRHIADIFVDGVSLAHHLLRCGLAIPYDGRGKAPRWPCEDW